MRPERHFALMSLIADPRTTSSSAWRALAGADRVLAPEELGRLSQAVHQDGAWRSLALVSPALREIAGAMEDVNAFRDTPAGSLRINAKERAAYQILRPVVAKYLRRYPDMQVELIMEGRQIDIVAEGFDAGIRLAESVPMLIVGAFEGTRLPPLAFVATQIVYVERSIWFGRAVQFSL